MVSQLKNKNVRNFKNIVHIAVHFPIIIIISLLKSIRTLIHVAHVLISLLFRGHFKYSPIKSISCDECCKHLLSERHLSSFNKLQHFTIRK